MPYSATGMDLDLIIQREGSQRKKDKHHMIHMNLFTKNKQTKIQKTSLWLPKGKMGDKLDVWD